MLYDFGPSTSHMRELLPMGAPLAPGKYIVGVYNRSSSQNCSYKLTSSGIGELGSGADFEVQNLPFSSGRSQVTLAPREASYYRVIIPEDTYRTWRVRVNKIDGDAGLAVKKDHIPDFRVSMDGDTEDPNSGYRLYHVTGDEVFTLLPPNGQEFLTGGEYFLALFGMGKEAAQTVGSTGSGDSLIELISEGELEIVNLGEISRVGDSIVKTLNVSDPDFEIFQLDVGSSVSYLNIIINKNDDVFSKYSALPGVFIPHHNTPFPQNYISIGTDQGSSPVSVREGGQTLTLLNQFPGAYTIAVSSGPANWREDINSQIVLKIEAVGVPQLEFSSHLVNSPDHTNEVTGFFNDPFERDYYRVEAPKFIPVDTPTGTVYQPVLGWKIALDNSRLSVRDSIGYDLLPSIRVEDFFIMVPPLFIPDRTYYIEVTAGQSEYHLSSSAILPDEQWIMPENLNLEFGVSEPQDLSKNDWRFYTVQVPENNGGLMRTELEVFEGDPDLYIRRNNPPTIHHDEQRISTENLLYDRRLIGQSYNAANWAPLDSREDARLEPGLWILGVRANQVNARYQLKVSTGQVEDIGYSEEGITVSDSLANMEDFKYYRVKMPEIDSETGSPAAWKLQYSAIGGKVSLHIRDTVPPGNEFQMTTSPNDFVDRMIDIIDDEPNRWPYWSNSRSGIHEPGTYEFTFPVLHPGKVYFVGVRARTPSSFSLTSSFTSAKLNDPAGSSEDYFTYGQIDTLNFFSTAESFELEPGAIRAFRLPTPKTPSGLSIINYHNQNVEFRFEQGTLPSLDTNCLFIETQGNSKITAKPLYNDKWPWRAGSDFYLLFHNKGESLETVEINLAGRLDHSPYEDWLRGSRLEGPNALLTAVNNERGISNILAYAFGLDPNKGSKTFSSIHPFPLAIQIDEYNVLGGTEYYIPVDAPQDILYTIQRSSSSTGPWETLSSKLGDSIWLGSGYVEESEGDRYFIRYRLVDLIPTSAEERMFYRLQVERLNQ